MRGFESRSVRILLSKISVEPIGLEASAGGVVTGFPKRDNIFEGNPPERITPRNRTPTRAAGCWAPSGSSVTSDSLIKLFHYVSVSPTPASYRIFASMASLWGRIEIFAISATAVAGGVAASIEDDDDKFNSGISRSL